MTTVGTTPPAPPSLPPDVRDPVPRLAMVGAGLTLFLLISTTGATWDIMWHQDVGPDTFFTAPHMLLYTGGAGMGLLALATVLVNTWRSRVTGATRSVDIGLLRGRFRAPLGVVVAGWGAMTFLLSGLYDQVWHAVYGFDAVFDSPPHIALGLADNISTAGLVILFAMLVTRRAGQSWWVSALAVGGLAMVVQVILGNSSYYQVQLVGQQIAGIDLSMVLIAVLYPLALVLVVTVVGRFGAAILTGVLFVAFNAVVGAFSAWATTAYADALGLFPRDNALGYSAVTEILPRFVLLAAVVIDVGLLLARRRGLRVRVAVPAIAAAGAVLLVGAELLVPKALPTPALPELAVTLIVAAGLGAVVGWVGRLAGLRLRNLPGALRDTAHAPAAPASERGDQ